MKKLIFKLGTIAGIISSSMLLLAFNSSLMDFEYGEVLGYTSMLIAFSTIFLGIRSYKSQQNGKISFGSAFKIGILITLVASCIYVISWMIISSNLPQDFAEEYYQKAVENINTSDITEAEKKEKIADMNNFKELYKIPVIKAAITFMEIFPVGFVISLISALILSRKDKQI